MFGGHGTSRSMQGSAAQQQTCRLLQRQRCGPRRQQAGAWFADMQARAPSSQPAPCPLDQGCVRPDLTSHCVVSAQEVCTGRGVAGTAAGQVQLLAHLTLSIESGTGSSSSSSNTRSSGRSSGSSGRMARLRAAPNLLTRAQGTSSSCSPKAPRPAQAHTPPPAAPPPPRHTEGRPLPGSCLQKRGQHCSCLCFFSCTSARHSGHVSVLQPGLAENFCLKTVSAQPAAQSHQACGCKDWGASQRPQRQTCRTAAEACRQAIASRLPLRRKPATPPCNGDIRSTRTCHQGAVGSTQVQENLDDHQQGELAALLHQHLRSEFERAAERGSGWLHGTRAPQRQQPPGATAGLAAAAAAVGLPSERFDRKVARACTPLVR